MQTAHTTDTPATLAVDAPAPGRKRRSWPVLLLALPAFVAIWSGWVELGRMTGFGPVKPLPGIADTFEINTAITLPIGVETYAAYAMYVWLGMDVSQRARRFARSSAIGSLMLGAGGQGAYHLMAAAGMVRAPWPIVALVACLPVLVLGMGAALAHLVHDGPDTAPAEESSDEANEAGTGTESVDEAEARTERAVIANALRERHPEWPADAIEGTTADMEPGESLPTPAPRVAAAAVTAPAAVTSTARTDASDRPARVRSGRSNAEKARAMRAKYPTRTNADIAQRIGVTERTVERYFSTLKTATPGTAASDLAA